MLLLELPQREIGGVLPAGTTSSRRRHGHASATMALHLDGARLWEAQPFYDRPHAEIAGLFDSVYVSFYKGLGGMAGAALAGDAETIAGARVWQRRHGGTLVTLHPFVAAAESALDERLERMPVYVEHARALAAALAGVEGIEVVPTRRRHRSSTSSSEEIAERLADAALGRRGAEGVPVRRSGLDDLAELAAPRGHGRRGDA